MPGPRGGAAGSHGRPYKADGPATGNRELQARLGESSEEKLRLRGLQGGEGKIADGRVAVERPWDMYKAVRDERLEARMNLDIGTLWLGKCPDSLYLKLGG